MTKTKAIILTAFLLAMGAGVAVGMLSSRALPPQNNMRARFIEELQLTPEQQKQIDGIWMEQMRGRMREFADEFRSIQQQRETAIAGLMSADQKEKYDQINQQFAQRARDLWKRGEEAFEAASARTRQILTESQRPKFDEMLNKFKAQIPSSDAWLSGGMPQMGMRGVPATGPAGAQ
jgi:cell division protein ZapA (FtsZ GTPase activity inhibitor)